MGALGVEIREIPIGEAAMLHFKSIGHDPEVHDVTYENTQARERTQILMDLANKENGLVIGTARRTASRSFRSWEKTKWRAACWMGLRRGGDHVEV